MELFPQNSTTAMQNSTTAMQNSTNAMNNSNAAMKSAIDIMKTSILNQEELTKKIMALLDGKIKSSSK